MIETPEGAQKKGKGGPQNWTLESTSANCLEISPLVWEHWGWPIHQADTGIGLTPGRAHPFNLQKERKEPESELLGYLFPWEHLNLHCMQCGARWAREARIRLTSGPHSARRFCGSPVRKVFAHVVCCIPTQTLRENPVIILPLPIGIIFFLPSL